MGCYQEVRRCDRDNCDEIQTEIISKVTSGRKSTSQHADLERRSKKGDEPSGNFGSKQRLGHNRTNRPKKNEMMLDLRIRPCRSIMNDFSEDECYHEYLMEHVEVMKKRENQVYAKRDFLDELVDGKIHESAPKRGRSLYVFCPGNVRSVVLLDEEEAPLSKHEPIDPTSREQMALWVFRIIDHFGLPREFGTLCLSYVDRFLGLHDCDKNVFKLSCMTCIYVTTKVHGVAREMILPRCLAHLSRGEFEVEDIQLMEEILLPALNWQVNPPTAYSYVRICGAFFLESTSIHVRDAMLNIACFLTDLATCDYGLICHKQSDVAGASILLAASMASKTVFTQDERNHLYDCVYQLFGTRKRADATKKLIHRLTELYRRSEQYQLCDVTHREQESQSSERQFKEARDSSSIHKSPSCVTVLRHKSVREERFHDV